MTPGGTVLVGSAGSSEIHVLRLDQDGGLAPGAIVPLPGVKEPGGSLPLAVSPDRRFLYAGVRSQPYQVLAFRIEESPRPEPANLAFIGSAPLADSMAYIATDRTGRTLFSASYGGSKVTVNRIGADGAVGAPQQILPTEPKAHAILPDPSNTVVLATSLGGDLIHRFGFDAQTGVLTPQDEPAARVRKGAGPRHFAFHPSGRFLYLLNELDATLDVFAVDGDGVTLTAIQTVPALPEGFAGKPWAADVHVTPDGRNLYASERTSSRLAHFRIDPHTGVLSSAGSTPTETQPRSFAIDPSGRFLVAAGELSHHVTSYAIDPASGDLTVVARRQAGRTPNWVEILVGGRTGG